MASGHVSVLPEDVAIAVERAVAESSATAAAAWGGFDVHRLQLGNNILRIRTTGHPLAATINRTFGPLVLRGDGPADADLVAFDSASTRTSRPLPEWSLPGRFEGAGRVITYDVDHPMLTVCRPADGLGIIWCPDGSALAPWEEAAPFRAVIDRLLGSHGTVFVHGGVVALEGRGVLLTAPGGSGKSTTVLACLAAGMSTLGDDFVLLDDADGARCATSRLAYALYATARLLPTSPGWKLARPETTAADDDVIEFDGIKLDGMGKRLLYVAELYPGQMIARADLVAVVVPRRAHSSPIPEAVRISSAAALRALAPTTLALTEARPEALAAMRSMCASLPCFELRVTPDLPAVVACVRGLIDVRTDNRQ